MNTRDWLVIGGAAAVIGLGLWWMEKPAAASAPTAPITTLVSGGRYQLVGNTPTGAAVDPSFASAVQNSLTAGGQWQNVTITSVGAVYTIQGTYVGPSGAPAPTAFGIVTKIG